MSDREQRFEMSTDRRDEEQRLEVTMDIEAEPQAVWKALTEAEELMRWFPLQARVKAGDDGNIWMSWDGDAEGDLPIEAWEPDRRLALGWPLPVPADEEPASPTALEIDIEGHAGSTTLRLVHSGFPVGDDWDEIFDAHRRGWAYELRSLRHYLENHRGKSRRVARTRRPIGRLTIEETWRLLWSPNGIVAKGEMSAPAPGPYAFTMPSGHRLEGRVMLAEAPTDLGATVTAIDGIAGSESSLFRISIESWSGPSGEVELHLWLATWGVEPAAVAAIEQSWEQIVDRMLADAAA